MPTIIDQEVIDAYNHLKGVIHKTLIDQGYEPEAGDDSAVTDAILQRFTVIRKEDA